MQVRLRGRIYLVFLIILNAAVAALLLTGIAFVGFATYAEMVLSGLLALGVLYALSNVWTFSIGYLRRPRFGIDIERGRLSIGVRGRELHLSSSDVSDYYVYNNKVLLAVHGLHGSMQLAPFVRIRKGRFLVVYLYLIGDISEFLRALAVFDDSFEQKRRTSLGMFLQTIGTAV